MEREGISAEQALFTVEVAKMQVDSVTAELARLVLDLRGILSPGAAADVTRPIEELRRHLQEAVDTSKLERIRSVIMEHSVPVDDVECATCGAPDFSNESCSACCSLRSDGLTLARRKAGWTV